MKSDLIIMQRTLYQIKKRWGVVRRHLLLRDQVLT